MLERMARPLRGLSNGIAIGDERSTAPRPARASCSRTSSTARGSATRSTPCSSTSSSAARPRRSPRPPARRPSGSTASRTRDLGGRPRGPGRARRHPHRADRLQGHDPTGERDVVGLHGLINIVATARLRHLAPAAPDRRPRRRVLGAARRVPDRDRGRLHRRPRRLQVRLHGEPQRLRQGKKAKEFTPSSPPPRCPEATPTKVMLRQHRGDARAPRRRGPRPEGHLLARRRAALEGASWRATRSSARGTPRPSASPTAPSSTDRPRRARRRTARGSTTARSSSRARRLRPDAHLAGASARLVGPEPAPPPVRRGARVTYLPTAEHDELRAVVRELAEERIAPRAAEIDENAEFP